MASWQSLLAAGQASLQNADWTRAKTEFEASINLKESPEAHDGLGIALWWLNEITAAHRQRVIAFRGFKKEGKLPQAAFVAAWLAREQLFLHGNAAAMSGWFARARRLQSQFDPCLESAWCDILYASVMANPADLERIAKATITFARGQSDDDLESFALAFGGLAKVVQGRVKGGLVELDEAMTMATSGEVGSYMAISEIFCVMLSACEAAGDLVRSEQWCRVAADFAERHSCPFLSAYCRTTYGSLLSALGRWGEAEIALSQAIAAFEVGHRGLRIHAIFKLADLRISQGRLEEAALLLQGFEDQGAAQLSLARLQYIKGETELARAIIAQALAGPDDATLHQISLLELMSEVCLAMDDQAGARQAVTAQQSLAEQSGSDFHLAQAAFCQGKIQLAAGDPDALTHFQAAIQYLQRYEQSCLAGQVRLEMAKALSASDQAGATAWAQAALATFERLGASRLADETLGLLREFGVPTPAGPRQLTTLTQRETEILALVAQGLSNKEIGGRLYISPKTVEHHVGRILSKLNVRNRAQAAALALGPTRQKNRGIE